MPAMCTHTPERIHEQGRCAWVAYACVDASQVVLDQVAGSGVAWLGRVIATCGLLYLLLRLLVVLRAVCTAARHLRAGRTHGTPPNVARATIVGLTLSCVAEVQLRWDRTKGALKPCVKYMQDHDCLRTLKIMPAMVQSYAAITGHDLWTSTQHVHSMLMCHDMWTWAMQICGCPVGANGQPITRLTQCRAMTDSLCESLTTMLVVVVMLFAGSFGFFYGYFHSSE